MEVLNYSEIARNVEARHFQETDLLVVCDF